MSCVISGRKPTSNRLAMLKHRLRHLKRRLVLVRDAGKNTPRLMPTFSEKKTDLLYVVTLR
nr:hypothetical protein [Candidatus Sigynarchaeota archaeon]